MTGKTRYQERYSRLPEAAAERARDSIYSKYAAAMGHDLPDPVEPAVRAFPRRDGSRGFD